MADEISGMPPVPGEKPKGHMSTTWAIVIIVVVALLIGGGIWYWYSKTVVKDTNVTIPEKTASTSASASASPQTNTKTYTSTSTYLPKFSYSYPSNWQVLKNDFSYYRGGYSDEKTGIDTYFSTLEFTKFVNEKENILETLHLKIKVYKDPRDSSIDNAFRKIAGDANTGYNDYIADAAKTDDITIGGVKTKKYLLGVKGVGDNPNYYFIGFMKEGAYFEFRLDDPENQWKHDLGAKAGFDTIISTWKFL